MTVHRSSKAVAGRAQHNNGTKGQQDSCRKGIAQRWYTGAAGQLQGGHSTTTVHRGSRTVAGGDLPLGCTTLWSPFHSTSASISLRDDVSVVTAHEVALSNLGLLLLQHCVQVLVPCTTPQHFQPFKPADADIRSRRLYSCMPSVMIEL